MAIGMLIGQSDKGWSDLSGMQQFGVGSVIAGIVGVIALLVWLVYHFYARKASLPTLLA